MCQETQTGTCKHLAQFILNGAQLIRELLGAFRNILRHGLATRVGVSNLRFKNFNATVRRGRRVLCRPLRLLHHRHLLQQRRTETLSGKLRVCFSLLEKERLEFRRTLPPLLLLCGDSRDSLLQRRDLARQSIALLRQRGVLSVRLFKRLARQRGLAAQEGVRALGRLARILQLPLYGRHLLLQRLARSIRLALCGHHLFLQLGQLLLRRSQPLHEVLHLCVLARNHLHPRRPLRHCTCPHRPLFLHFNHEPLTPTIAHALDQTESSPFRPPPGPSRPSPGPPDMYACM